MTNEWIECACECPSCGEEDCRHRAKEDGEGRKVIEHRCVVCGYVWSEYEVDE